MTALVRTMPRRSHLFVQRLARDDDVRDLLPDRQAVQWGVRLDEPTV
jgi:hypothetical protein